MVAPLTGWGTWGTTGFIHFSIVRDDTAATLPDWAFSPKLAVQPIPGGDAVRIQNMGMGPATVTWRLWFDAAADYRRFLLAMTSGATGTLTVVAGTQGLTGADEYVQGWTYTHLDNVLITGIDQNGAVRYPSGEVEVSVSFLRAVDSATLGSVA